MIKTRIDAKQGNMQKNGIPPSSKAVIFPESYGVSATTGFSAVEKGLFLFIENAAFRALQPLRWASFK